MKVLDELWRECERRGYTLRVRAHWDATKPRRPPSQTCGMYVARLEVLRDAAIQNRMQPGDWLEVLATFEEGESLLEALEEMVSAMLERLRAL